MKTPTIDFNKINTVAQQYATTLLTMLSIVVGVTAALILFDSVDASQELKNLTGAVLLAFAVVAFASVVHNGTKKGRK
jgi:peptidoglycan/LPS O-acetylase OafA/YrhL